MTKKFKVGDRIRVDAGCGAECNGTVIEPSEEQLSVNSNESCVWAEWDDGDVAWVDIYTDDVKKIKPKKFAIGAKVIDSEGQIGIVCECPPGHELIMDGEQDKIFWATWPDCGQVVFEFKKLVKRYNEPVEIKADVTVTMDDIDPTQEEYQTTLEFKNCIAPMKNAFRGASVMYNDSYGHIVGYVKPSGHLITQLCLNIYGNHYYVDAIEVVLL